VHRVGWAAHRNNPVKSTVPAQEAVASVYVRFMAMSADGMVSEEILRGLFGYYGPVLDCAIKKLRVDPVSNSRASLRYQMVFYSCLCFVNRKPTAGRDMHSSATTRLG
jgi:hypothetical protein